MPNPIIKGKKGDIKKITRITFDPSQGHTTTIEYESGGNNLGGLANQCEKAGHAYTHEMLGHRSRLVETISSKGFTNEEALERFELFSNQNTLDVREHPKSKALGTEVLANVLLNVKRHEQGKTAQFNFPPENVEAYSLFLLLISGTTHFPVWNWTLRYTANVSNQYLGFLPKANSGVGTIYTNAQIANFVPAGRMRDTVQSITPPAGDSEVFWGWLKKGVSETQTAKNRVDVSAEFELAQWSVFLFL